MIQLTEVVKIFFNKPKQTKILKKKSKKLKNSTWLQENYKGLWNMCWQKKKDLIFQKNLTDVWSQQTEATFSYGDQGCCVIFHVSRLLSWLKYTP
jgi:hypothetical protein